ncbi:STAS domain-containing protein [Blastococcus sp. MG754426]|uniref:STAS domain-containing protein n=1 Tax=unclassified Blastococcus TaxID=2619396 RepID=UPI001EF13716|nr:MULTISPECIES: STAS domain-containing protein [unclassified Blastococcus]MCF6507420.1 STAS domain-containing protein [Blastococcus sp. MG754426]MCF6512032.1 STAS domain-containing protein [Blastococcus sp. MG754427]MCF6734927.1 STAS domain-containing protein [Blastococcus sp. KM273129]
MSPHPDLPEVPLDLAPVPFRLDVDLVGATVAVAGELDREHVHLLLDGLAALADGVHRPWSVDAAEVVFCDAAGLRALVTAHHLARRHGCTLVVERPSPCLHRLILLVGLDQMLHLRPAGPAPGPAAAGRRPLPHTGPLRVGHPVRAVPAEV